MDLIVVKDGYETSDVIWKTPRVLPGGTVEAVIEIKETKYFRGFLAGKILMPDGAPLANASGFLQAEPEHLKGHFRRGRLYTKAKQYPLSTGANGSFQVELPAHRADLVLCFPGYCPINLGRIEIKAGEKFAVTKPLKLVTGYKMKVCVVDAAGQPIEDAIVLVNDSGENGIVVGKSRGLWKTIDLHDGRRIEHHFVENWSPKIRETDGKGVAKFAELRSGKAGIAVIAQGYTTAQRNAVELVKGNAGIDVKFTLKKRGSIVFKVADTTGNAVKYWNCRHDTQPEGRIPSRGGVVVRSQVTGGCLVQVAEDGNMRPLSISTRSIRAIPGKHRFVFSAPGYRTKVITRELKAGQQIEETIQLEGLDTGSVSGTIKPASGMPLDKVGQVILGLYPRNFFFGERPPTVLILDKKGRFKLDKVLEGENYITILDTNGSLLGLYRINTVKGKTTRINIKLPPVSNVAGRLLDRKGKPLGGTLLILRDRRSIDAFPSGVIPSPLPKQNVFTTDRNGRFHLGLLAEGGYLINADNLSLVWSIDVKGGSETNVALKQLGTSTVSGKLSGNTDAVTITLTPADSPFSDTWFRTDVRLTDDGKFKITGVCPGKYPVKALSGTMGYGCLAEIEVKEGQSLSGIELDLSSHAQRISGKISKYHPPGGNDYSYPSSDTVVASGSFFARAEVRADGSFEFYAPPGKYKLHRLGPHLVCNNTRDNVKPLEIVIEEGKDLEGIELNAEQ